MKKTTQPVKIGLTGGIASGKTTAQKVFEALGVPCIDHDKLARDVVAAGSKGLKQLVSQFGQSILTENQELNRPALKEIIFNNPEAKKEVEGIIHPLVFEASESIIEKHSDAPYILIVSPLLIESGSAKNMHKLVVVDIPRDIQLQRLLSRDGMSETLANSIIASQATPEQRHAAADYILDNNGSLEELRMAAQKCHQDLLKTL